MTEPAPEATEKTPAKKTAAPADKPMGATQRRDLQKLIDGDFDSLKGEIAVFASELRINRLRQIEEEFEEQDRQARAVEAEWTQFSADLRRQADEWMRRKREEGFYITSASQSYGREQALVTNPIKVGLPAKERAIKDAENVVSHQKMMALQALERQRLQMQKDVLLDSLVGSSKARELLQGMPNPRELLASIMAGVRQAGLPVVQQIEGNVVVRHGHDEAPILIGEILEDEDVDA